MIPEPAADSPLAAITPWRAVGLVALLSLAALLGLGETWLAWLILGLTALAGLLHPRNALILTLTACPFILGEPQDPYIFLINALAGLTLACWLVHLILARRRPRVPLAGLIALLALIMVLNPPLNLKELAATFGQIDAAQIWRLLVEGRKFHDLYALRELILNLGGLAFLVCCLDLLRPKDLAPLGLALMTVTAVLSAASLALYLGWLPTGRPYLSLNLVGTVMRFDQALLASTAFNRQYLNELIVPMMAVAGWAAWRGRGQARWWALAAGLVMLATLAASGQRSPFICLVVMAGVAAALIIHARGRRGMVNVAWLVIGLTALLAVVVIGDETLGQGHLTGRFLGLGGGDVVAGIGERPLVWRTAAQMIAAHPLTGLGAGTFRLLARPYVEAAGLAWQSNLIAVLGTAHSSLFQWAAELGLVSLALLLVLGFRLAAPAWRAYSLGIWRGEAAVLLTALAGLACFGLFQHITYLSSLALVLLAILAGCAVLEDGPVPKRVRSRPKTVGMVVMALGLALLIGGVKVKAIYQTPFRPEWRIGFSDLGSQPDGRQAWWTTGRRSVWTVPVRRPILATQIRLYHPIVLNHPQQVTFRVEDKIILQRTLKDLKWHKIKLDLSPWDGREVRLIIETGYTFRPYSIDRNNPDRRTLGVMIKDMRYEHKKKRDGQKG